MGSRHFCRVCRTAFDSDAEETGVFNRMRCPINGCKGRVSLLDEELADFELVLSSKGFEVEEIDFSYSFERRPIIIIRFVDDYGHHFDNLPEGFQLVGSNPEKNPAPTPIEIIKFFDTDLTREERFKALAQAKIDLMNWAERLY